jgi:hypothetical protein
VAVPDPVPEPLTEIHAVELKELQVQPAPVVTVMEPVADDAATDTLVGATV